MRKSKRQSISLRERAVISVRGSPTVDATVDGWLCRIVKWTFLKTVRSIPRTGIIRVSIAQITDREWVRPPLVESGSSSLARWTSTVLWQYSQIFNKAEPTSRQPMCAGLEFRFLARIRNRDFLVSFAFFYMKKKSEWKKLTEENNYKLNICVDFRLVNDELIWSNQ